MLIKLLLMYSTLHFLFASPHYGNMLTPPDRIQNNTNTVKLIKLSEFTVGRTVSDFGNQMLLVKNTCPTLTSLSLFDAARAPSSPPC